MGKDADKRGGNSLEYDRRTGVKFMRSDAVTKGAQQAPHRSLFHALGMTQEGDGPSIGGNCKFL